MIRLLCPAMAVLAFVCASASAAEEAMISVFDPPRATSRISVTVDPGRTSMTGLPNALVIARSAMHAGDVLPQGTLRKLADAGDGLAAQRLVRALLKDGMAEAEASDIAYYAAQAVGSGRIWTLPDMIAAMERLDPETEPRARVRRYIRVLYPHAWAGNGLALDAVIDFNGEGRLFGPLTEATRQRILAQAARNGDGRVELRMALAQIKNDAQNAGDRAKTRALLARAAGSPHPGIAAAAATLMTELDETVASGS